MYYFLLFNLFFYTSWFLDLSFEKVNKVSDFLLRDESTIERITSEDVVDDYRTEKHLVGARRSRVEKMID